jgi:hypothetical protein
MTTKPTSDTTTPVLCQPAFPGVTTCECGTEFASRPGKKFCTNVCRQRAYRKSPAHEAILAGQKQQRLNRRNAWIQRRDLFENRYKYLSFDGRVSGPSNDYLPTLKSLDLKNCSKKME